MRQQHPLTRRTPARDFTLQLLARTLHVCVSLTYRHHTCTCGTVPLYVSETAASTSGYRSSHRTGCPKASRGRTLTQNQTRKDAYPWTPQVLCKHTNTWKIVYTKRIRTSDRSHPHPVPDPSTPFTRNPSEGKPFRRLCCVPSVTDSPLSSSSDSAR